MTDLDSSSLFIQKPRKPQQVDAQGVDYGINDPRAKNVHTRVNYLMEMMKFFPDYERKMYAGAEQQDIIAAMQQYAEPQEENGLITPRFGDVVRSMSGEAIRANAQGSSVRGLQFEDKEITDYEHLDNQTLETKPVTAGLDQALWNKVKAALKNEKDSYYDIMMKNKVAEYTPEKAFYVMVSMLESRTRIYSAMGDIYGTPDMSGEQRQTIFNQWYAANKDSVSEGELGFLRFFLDLQQSFVAHANPLAGGSDEQVESSIDKERSAQFFNTLSDKVQEYLTINPELGNLWKAWVNPTVAISPEQNTDPLQDTAVKSIYDKLALEMDKVVSASLGSKSVTRSRYRKYKTDMEDYETKVDEERQQQADSDKRLRQQQATERSLQEKLAAQARASRAQADKVVRKGEASKPVYVQKTRSAMANKVSIRTNPNAASVPVAARAMVRRQTTSAAAQAVSGSSNRVAASTAKRRPLAMAAKPLSAKSSKILSATVSNLFKGRASKANSSGKFVKRQPKSKLSVS